VVIPISDAIFHPVHTDSQLLYSSAWVAGVAAVLIVAEAVYRRQQCQRPHTHTYTGRTRVRRSGINRVESVWPVEWSDASCVDVTRPLGPR
jgi:hypothetical protein